MCLLLLSLLYTAQANNDIAGEQVATLVDRSTLVARVKLADWEGAFHTYGSGRVVQFTLATVDVEAQYVGTVSGNRLQVATSTLSSDLGAGQDFDSVVIFATRKAGGALAGLPPEGLTFPVCFDTAVLVQEDYYLGVRDGALYLPHRGDPACLFDGVLIACDDGAALADLEELIEALPSSEAGEIGGAP